MPSVPFVLVIGDFQPEVPLVITARYLELDDVYRIAPMFDVCSGGLVLIMVGVVREESHVRKGAVIANGASDLNW